VLEGGFYRPERWAPRVTSGGGAPWSRVKRRKGEGCWGWSRAAGNLERLPARQDKAGLRDSEGSPMEACSCSSSFLRPNYGEGR
jgi:hypothetical protein